MDVCERFLQHLDVERRLSAGTVEAYEVSLRLFRDFLVTLPEPRTLCTADSDNIREWMEQLMEQGKSASYVSRSLAALRTFYRFCLAAGIVSVDPARSVTGPKRSRRLPRFVKDAEMDELVEMLYGDGDGQDERFCDVRARTIIYVFYLTGLRVSELISLDDSMIDFVGRELKVTGKRNKQRVVPFGEELENVLLYYIRRRDAEVARGSDALFVSQRGCRVSYSYVRGLVKEKLQTVCSLDKCTPHVLRHTFATAMLNNGANLESIKKLMGHQSLNTTEIYTHTTFEQLKRAYGDAHPRVTVKKKE
ncbi:MAG: tyrosine-type recombinase/integrase [Bacteroidales bacterium]|nr:tyrosine-type recombinase/integrase [Bacteroidales bacterium]MCM1147220.1 tyrosine-type recombinase/integrase [Bacteroidales bacterium]MCM1207245.1 tyrosine-type recombinase/integrase [Bacillota bacterium]MCM1509750.1 tyrosine-type recombinase/integrase [Clostridium sp.]